MEERDGRTGSRDSGIGQSMWKEDRRNDERRE